MAINGKPGHGRVGVIKNRTQFPNPAIDGKYTKRNTENGQFAGNKADTKPFKDIRKEK